MKTRTLKLSEIVLDYNLYPRTQVDSTNVARITSARQAGEDVPPPIVDDKGLRVVDGFHRVTSWRQTLEPDAEVLVEVRSYKSDADLFIDAVSMNARHGKPLSPFDRARCALRMRKFRVGIAKMAQALGVRPETLKAVAEKRVALREDGSETIVKRVIAYKAGTTLTPAQEVVNARLSGRSTSALVGDLIGLIETDLIDVSDSTVIERLHRLGELLDAWRVANPLPEIEGETEAA